jgi:hypothetical protein
MITRSSHFAACETSTLYAWSHRSTCSSQAQDIEIQTFIRSVRILWRRIFHSDYAPVHKVRSHSLSSATYEPIVVATTASVMIGMAQRPNRKRYRIFRNVEDFVLVDNSQDIAERPPEHG